MTASEEFPGWEEASESGTLTLTITITGEEIRLATVLRDDELDLYATYIGLPFAAKQLGRWDASQARAVAKATRGLLADKLRRLF